MNVRSASVRQATRDDAAACVEIYRPFVEDTAISFETEVPAVEEMAARITAAQQFHDWLVYVDGDEILGYAYGGPFKSRAAYRWSAEVSVYVARHGHRTGVGRALYGALIPRLEERGYRRLIAGVTQPNEASIRFHKSFGFRFVGRYDRVGFKLGAWRDVTYLQLDLHDRDEPPPEIL